MYTSITSLPTSTHNLPYNGKRIYLKFFNRAYEKYGNEATAAKIAWQAVKRKYYKRNDEWIVRADANEYDTTTTDDTSTTTTTTTTSSASSTDDDDDRYKDY
ncbi:ChaB-like [Alphabaculovirus myunipunctae]|uniref:ChaB-like n=1 Tax=Mythimna unipuncta nucleopolyhedrovirus TaxID=447897 RepID=A0A2K9VSF2_9ABAC|nr:ChaB-like [Mythimna unipuncta nucleopolyhedrovirus]AUV65374.1 ChaB-like [Mythimna unipuncta nucleopolyhedrovirus]